MYRLAAAVVCWVCFLLNPTNLIPQTCRLMRGSGPLYARSQAKPVGCTCAKHGDGWDSARLGTAECAIELLDGTTHVPIAAALELLVIRHTHLTLVQGLRKKVGVVWPSLVSILKAKLRKLVCCLVLLQLAL
jgi:hypothetical protein